jgi:hypothetical protein
VPVGRLTFTQDEIDEIRSLLRDLRHADRDAQKKIRRKLRAMDFNISDFSDGSEGFTRADLDELILRGTVKVQK